VSTTELSISITAVLPPSRSPSPRNLPRLQTHYRGKTAMVVSITAVFTAVKLRENSPCHSLLQLEAANEEWKEQLANKERKS